HAVTLGGAEVFYPFEQAGVAAGTYLSIAEFTLVRPLYLAAQLLRHGLHAVTNAQHGNATLEHRGRHRQRAITVGRCMTARQDDATEVLLFFDKAVINITRMNFAIHT